MTSTGLTFDDYINQFMIEKGQAYTHTKIGSKEANIAGGTYFIPEDERSNFHKKYFKYVFTQGKMTYLTEKQLVEDGPLLVDIDMRYTPQTKKRQHTKEHIIDLIMIYASKILEIFQIPNKTRIPVYVMQKKDVNILEDKTKDGIHIIFAIKMHKAAQVMLREAVIKELRRIWDDLPLINDFEDVIDLGITKGSVNWQLYGSRKPGHKSYILEHKFCIEYLEDDNDWTIEEDDETFDLKKHLRILSAQYDKHPEFPVLETTKTKYAEAKVSLTRKAFPKYKLITKSRINSDADFKNIKSHKMLDEYIANLFENINAIDYELKETHEFVQILPESYYGSGSYNKWIRVGWALKNTDNRLLVSWIKFSSKSSEFKWENIDELLELWQSFDCENPDGLTYRSIMYWAKNSEHEKYNKIRLETVGYFIEETVKTSAEWDLANVLYQIYKDDFICVSIKNNIWYEYKNHRWYEIDSGNTLRLLISKNMHNIYCKKAQEITQKLVGMDQNEESYDIMKKKSCKLIEICVLLKKTNWKNNIMREARELFYDKNFMNNLDQNPYLLCFNNYVIDFKTKTYRQGLATDYISKCTNIEYVDASKQQYKEIKAEINKFIDEIFPNTDLRRYMWEHLASCLLGTNENQTFNIYTGSGCNGKSKLVELMSKCLGDYKATVPTTLITQGRASVGSTSSEIVQLKGVRYAVMQEPSKGDKINEGIMKEITGGDPLQGRALYHESITFTPQFTLAVCTNTLFDIKSNDDGTWRRIRVCEFMSKFMERPNEDQDKFPKENFPYQYKIDKRIDDKFKSWAPVFMSMLVDVAFETQGNVKDCNLVLARSDLYREGQDYLAEFAKEKISKRVDSKIKKTELLEEFKLWYMRQYGRTTLPNGREISEYMDKRYGKCSKGKWYNVSMLYDNDDNDDEDNNEDESDNSI